MKILWVFALLSVLACTEKSKPSLSGDMELTWELVSNLEPEGSKAQFTFKNRGNQPIDQQNWVLYFNQNNVMPKAQNSTLGEVSHINGDLYCFKPLHDFILQPGDSLVLTYFYRDPMIKVSDAPKGLYFTEVGVDDSIKISSPKNYRVKPFLRPEQNLRSENDHFPIQTAEQIFKDNQTQSALNLNGRLPLIPSPFEAEVLKGSFDLTHKIQLSYAPEFKNEAIYLKGRIESVFDAGVELISGNKGDIVLAKSKARHQKQSHEAYDLLIGQKGVEIRADHPVGIFYGIQSLMAIQKTETRKEKLNQLSFPKANIYDWPRFGYRGFQLDVGRNFQSKETIKKLLDVLANYKINTFLFYLTEDEGWRLDIEGLPELAEVGGQRHHADVQDAALHPAYGSGPEAYARDSHGSGYYSKQDFIEILKYAQERHIEVIPEVNLPGHARAAIKAMEKRYARFMEEGNEEEANRYRLIDPEDRSKYSSAQSFKDNVVCVCRPSVYDFYEKVIDVIISYYEEAEVPLRYFHVGGDEVPEGPWTESPLCQKILAAEKDISGPENLHAYFFNRVVQTLKDRNLRIAGWEEVALKKENGINQVNPEFADGSVVPYVWNTLWGAQDLGYQLANRGYPVILCPVTNFYFDLAYNNHPEEPGLYWAGFVNTKNAYQYAPFDVFKSTDRDDAYYSPMDADSTFAQMERLTAIGRKNILGLQAQLWSETVKGPSMLEYYLLPKLLGFAESAWSKERIWETTEDPILRQEQMNAGWNELANRIGQFEFRKLDLLYGGFAYRIPPPGAALIEGQVMANTSYPGLTIRYTTDGSEPDENDAIYLGPIRVENKSPIKFKAFNREGRSSRTTTLTLLNLNFTE